MSDTELKTKLAQDKAESEITPAEREKIDARLKELGLKPPGYIREMMDNDMKDVEIAFLE
mgnify:FL=1